MPIHTIHYTPQRRQRQANMSRYLDFCMHRCLHWMTTGRYAQQAVTLPFFRTSQ